MKNSKNKHETIGIVLEPEIIKKLNDKHYNKSSLINSLLEKYFKKLKKKRK